MSVAKQRKFSTAENGTHGKQETKDCGADGLQYQSRGVPYKRHGVDVDVGGLVRSFHRGHECHQREQHNQHGSSVFCSRAPLAFHYGSDDCERSRIGEKQVAKKKKATETHKKRDTRTKTKQNKSLPKRLNGQKATGIAGKELRCLEGLTGE